MYQLAAQTGIGTQVIPWADLAETAARNVVDRNAAALAQSIQGITHPTGRAAVLAERSIAKLDDRILVELKVDWKGGTLGTPYRTVVTWEIAKSGHVGAKVLTDSAIFEVGSKNAQFLDEFFRTKVYPLFYSAVSGAAS